MDPSSTLNNSGTIQLIEQIIMLLICFGAPIWAGVLAYKKGYNPILWPLLLGPLALIAMALVKHKKEGRPRDKVILMSGIVISITFLGLLAYGLYMALDGMSKMWAA